MFTLLPVSHCNGSPLPLPARLFLFCLTPYFAPISLFGCSSPSSVLVRWNIGPLLMIQQSFLYLSIHLLLIVKLLSGADSRQAWFPFNSKSRTRAVQPDRLSSSPVTHTTHAALITTRGRQIGKVSGITVLTGEVEYSSIRKKEPEVKLSLKQDWHFFFQYKLSIP